MTATKFGVWSLVLVWFLVLGDWHLVSAGLVIGSCLVFGAW
jgi:hypothetical protein